MGDDLLDLRRALPDALALDLAQSLLEPAESPAGQRVAEVVASELGVAVLALVVYGSRSRGEAHAASDWDVVAVTGPSKESGLFGVSAGADIDLHVYEAHSLETREPATLAHFADGRCIFERTGAGQALLSRAAAAPRTRAVTESEVDRIACWAPRMLRRIRQDFGSSRIVSSLFLATLAL